ncbi:MAG: DUF4258 domain-containing protein [Patescibacteria group bacterium]
MQIEYTDHSIERITERDISKKAIREAFVHGQRKERQAEGLMRVVYNKQNKKLIVIYKLLSKDKYLIITAYYDGN